ncbi:MAG: GC-type dockerin domain-anchored protein [Planctomycetota bacterium]|nr:GC-type dockerin domain-anchored protein [Planctomycetota bacterium]
MSPYNLADAASDCELCVVECFADWNGDFTVNTQDYIAFLNSWNANESDADLNGDGSINTQDVTVFLNAWNAGDCMKAC